MAEPDRLASLEALRDLLADRLAGDEEAKQTAPLAKQYRETLREIDELKRGTKKGSLVDELAKRRKARSPATKSRAPARKRSTNKGS